jgi:hypothetical protein
MCWKTTQAADGLEMARDKGNWVDESQWDDEVQSKGSRMATVPHAMGMIGHVAHSTATGTHKTVDVEQDEHPLLRQHEAREGKLEDWIASREKTGRRRQQFIL